MAVTLPIYMDNHATTPVDPRVLEAMLPYFTNKFGNAASRNHSFGWAGEEAVENGRQQIASLINATSKEIIFTSGATESDNLMIKGIAEMFREKGNHVITQAIEHKAVLDTCKNLEKHGFEVTYLPVQKDGRVSLDDLKAAIKPTTILITIMYANNEIGVVNPIAEIGKIAKERGIFFAVHGKENPSLLGNLADFRDGIDDANFVVGIHDGDQDRGRLDSRFQIVQADPPVLLHRQIGDLETMLFEVLAGIKHGFVLDGLRDDVVALLAEHFRDALDHQIVRLGRAAGKNNLFRGGVNQRSDLLTPVFYGFFASPAEGMIAACGIAEFIGEIRQHR